MIDTDPAAAKASLREVRTETTTLLANLRRLVGLLRQPGAEQGAGASLDGIPALVDRAEAHGLPTRLQVHEGPAGLDARSDLGPIAQMAMFRMVQESLANAAIHAPGSTCTVILDDRDPAAVVATVTNTAPGSGPLPANRSGLGLVGMRERADLTGSTLTFGPTAAGGWQVRLTSPRDRAAPGEPARGEPTGGDHRIDPEEPT